VEDQSFAPRNFFSPAYHRLSRGFFLYPESRTPSSAVIPVFNRPRPEPSILIPRIQNPQPLAPQALNPLRTEILDPRIKNLGSSRAKPLNPLRTETLDPRIKSLNPSGIKVPSVLPSPAPKVRLYMTSTPIGTTIRDRGCSKVTGNEAPPHDRSRHNRGILTPK